MLAVDALKLRSLLEENCPVGFSIMTEVVQAYFSRYIEILKTLQGVVDPDSPHGRNLISLPRTNRR